MITSLCRILAAITAVSTVIAAIYILNNGGQFLGGNGLLGLLAVTSFFLSISLITWTCGEIYAMIESAQLELRSLRGQRPDAMNAALTDLRKAVERLSPNETSPAGPSVPAKAGQARERPAPASPDAASSKSETTQALITEECAIEQGGAPTRPELRAVISNSRRGWILVDYQPLFPGDAPSGSLVNHDEARAEARRLLTERLVNDGWEPLPADGPDALPRFRRKVAKAKTASA